MKLTEATIKGILDNDRRVITEFYYLCFNSMMSVASRYSSNVEDQKLIVNNAFMKVLDKFHTFDHTAPIEPWIRRIARNEVIDAFRKDKNYRLLFDLGAEQELPAPPELTSYERESEKDFLRRILLTLPPATRMVFDLFAIEGYTNKEICEELKIGTETVKWHLKEARKRIKVTLDKNALLGEILR